MHEPRDRLLYEVARRQKRGDSRRCMARALGINRRTVGRLLAELHERRETGDDLLAREVGQRAPKPSKLDKYADFIASLLAEHPNIHATRLLEELQAIGFDGQYTIVRQYLKRVRPKRTKQARRIVETAPGLQAQVDWAVCALADGTPVYAFSCILSYSRCQYLHFCTDMRQPTIFRQMRAAFDYLGGVASEYVFDSMAGIVDRWEMERPVLNLRAVDFAAFYDFEYHIAPRADGAYKGKVERMFRFVRGSLFNGRTIRTLDELNELTAHWLRDKRNGRTHSRTRRVPLEALRDERLQAIPPHPYDDRELAHRIVDSYSYVAFDGNWYRVPQEHVGQWVYVRASDAEVAVVAGPATVVVRHPRHPRNTGRYEPAPTRCEKKPRRRPTAELLACFAAWGAPAERFAEQLALTKRGAAGRLGRLLELRETWAVDDLLAAIERANRYGAWEVAAVERILKATATPRTSKDVIADRARRRIRQTLATTPVRQRPVDAYARLLGGTAHTEGARGEPDEPEKEPT